MSTGNWMTQEQPGQWRASKLEGLDVYNSNNEKIGDISELLVDNSGKIQAVVIGVGGFLGMGEHDVAVPFEQMTFVNEPRAVASHSDDHPAHRDCASHFESECPCHNGDGGDQPSRCRHEPRRS